ncbi:SAM-dependent methyltransferase [Ferruginivarius sediminum]|uniref:Class I SAM-dependent methyltransferase n=1 Tax=Ferruginivarius sediminum TaxID=2661937 RepID=A0A369T7S6_9PROT|nr:cyclopropane-fatty-acyl-phospholipid synthase family protein [Ferruginivarius sediminum]RDD61389.1 class I SAM-dependent methyltransferase [Ferruginivarius sediminum]
MTTTGGSEFTDARPCRKDRAGTRLLLTLVRRIRAGRLTLILPDGEQHTVIGSAPGPHAELSVHRMRMLRRLLTGGALGFAEAYMDGDSDSEDITALLALAAQNQTTLAGVLRGKFVSRACARLFHLLRPNTRRGARRNIAAHYDLGNDFYQAWLDPTMTYSAAVFAHPGQDLARAQEEKYRRMAGIADIRPEHHVLEIGCGWGGFAEFAAREIGCRVTGVTISEAQHDYARRRLADAGLDGRTEVALRDYRNLEGRYDRIVSIEMVEAVGEAWWPTFFQRLHDLLKPGGRVALQAITIADEVFPSYRRNTDFIQRYIFPGGMLPCPTALHDHAGAAGLRMEGAAAYGLDYAETLHRWQQAFERAWPGIAKMGFDERFRRMWRYYLAYCETGFREGRIDLYQIAFSRHSTTTGTQPQRDTGE